jgi:hypothetical protein
MGKTSQSHKLATGEREDEVDQTEEGLAPGAPVSRTTRTEVLRRRLTESTSAPTDPDMVLLLRLASTMRRAGRCQFNAALISGEPIVLSLDEQEGRALFAIKMGRTVLHTSDLAAVSVEASPTTESSAVVTGSHGYRTEVVFARKKTAGGMDFAPSQARDLFMLTVKAFQGAPVDKQERPKKAVRDQKA